MSTSTNSDGYSADASGYITARPRPARSHQSTDLDSMYESEDLISQEVSSHGARSSRRPSEEPPVPVMHQPALHLPNDPYFNGHTGRPRTRAQARKSIPPSTRFSFRMPTGSPSHVVTGLTPVETQQFYGVVAGLQLVQARLKSQGEILASMTEHSPLIDEGVVRALENSKTALVRVRRMERWCALGVLLMVMMMMMMFLVLVLALYLG